MERFTRGSVLIQTVTRERMLLHLQIKFRYRSKFLSVVSEFSLRQLQINYYVDATVKIEPFGG